MVVTGIAVLIATFKDMATIAAGALNSILDYFQGLGLTVHAFFTDLASGNLTFSGMAAASAEANAKVKKDFEDMTTDVVKNGEILGEEFRKVWKGFGDEAEEATNRAKTAVSGVTAEGAGKPAVPEIDTRPWGQATREVEALTEALKANEDALAGRHSKVETGFFSERGGGAHHPEELAPVFADALEKAVKDAEAATGQKANFTELFRTFQQQADIRAAHEAMPGGVAAHPAAPAGTSMHEIGGAADISQGAVLQWLHAHIGQYPDLEFLTGSTGANDPGHIQYRGGRASQSALEASKASATTTGEPPTGEEREKLLEKQKELNLELDKAKQKLLDIKTEEAGGTETSKAKLDIDEADAKQKGDAVANAQKLQGGGRGRPRRSGEERRHPGAHRSSSRPKSPRRPRRSPPPSRSRPRARLASTPPRRRRRATPRRRRRPSSRSPTSRSRRRARTSRRATRRKPRSWRSRPATPSSRSRWRCRRRSEEIAAARTAAQDKIKESTSNSAPSRSARARRSRMTKAALAEEIAQEQVDLRAGAGARQSAPARAAEDPRRACRRRKPNTPSR